MKEKINDQHYSNSKKLLLDISEDIFCLNGYKTTSVREIGRQAGLNSSMITYYFKSKDNLLFSVIQRRLNEFYKIITDTLGQALSTQDRLFVFINLNVEMVFDHQQLFRFLTKELRGNIPQSSKELINDFFRSLFEILKKIIETGINDKEFNVMDAEICCYSILSTVMHTSIDDKFGIGQPKYLKKERILHYFDQYFSK